MNKLFLHEQEDELNRPSVKRKRKLPTTHVCFNIEATQIKVNLIMVETMYGNEEPISLEEELIADMFGSKTFFYKQNIKTYYIRTEELKMTKIPMILLIEV